MDWLMGTNRKGFTRWKVMVVYIVTVIIGLSIGVGLFAIKEKAMGSKDKTDNTEARIERDVNYRELG